jgi:hypothetical protein
VDNAVYIQGVNGYRTKTQAISRCLALDGSLWGCGPLQEIYHTTTCLSVSEIWFTSSSEFFCINHTQFWNICICDFFIAIT